jgi:BioD-like phosphotransacetylase family protein
MAKTIYVTSTQNFSGKSALCAGLIRRLQQDRFTLGYMKPVSTTARLVGRKAVDEDAQFMKSHFGLTDAVETMVPVVLTDQKVAAVLAGDEKDLTDVVRSAFETISRQKDVVVLEGGGSLREGWIVNLAPPHVSDLLKAKELVVIPYGSDLQVVDDLITARLRLGESLLGGVVNTVPRHRLDFVRNEVKPYVKRRGITIFGVIPRERVLLSVSVRELAEGVKGEILCAERALEELVEHLLVGAMSVDSALTYFRRRPNKAVITGGDRPDIQLAAMETSTRCLILTGNIRPGSQIISRAEEQGVPIVLTRHDTMTAIERIEGFFGKTRFHQDKKVKRFEELLGEHMDFKALYKLMGLRSQR